MSEPSQEAILAALQSQTSFRARNPPNTSTYADLADPAELTKTSGDALVNSRKLYCPRAGCSCVIIGAGAATYIEAKADILPREEGSPFASSSSKGYFHIAGSPFAFDNIGFSKPDSKTTLPADAPGVADAKGKVKWLICAECDLGPLGWSFEGADEAWLAVDRLRYAAEPA